jgi:hypothetical protein
MDYQINGHTLAGYFRSMSVTYGDGTLSGKYPVTEYFVDINGNLLPIPNNPNAEPVEPGKEYTKAVPDLTAYGYAVIGYKWGAEPDGTDNGVVKTGWPQKIIDQPEKIYFVYKPHPGYGDVTVSKTVTGINPDKIKEFTFTVSFMDDNGNLLKGQTFSYTGGILPNTGAAPPANGTLTADSNGEAVFHLKHGQTITIQVQVGYRIKIVESPDIGYRTSYKDSGDIADSGNEEMDFKIVGTNARAFDFENRRITAPPTGVNTGNGVMEAILFGSLLMILAGLILSTAAWKRMRTS